MNTACEVSSELLVSDNIIHGGLSPGEIHIEGNFNIGTGGRLPNYDGSCSVIPKTYEQTLETKNKTVTEDIVIEEIPYSEVLNLSGGNTVNIAYIP